MKLVRLPVGTPADTDVDCLRIEEQDDRRFRLTGSALCDDGDEPDSISIVGGPHFPTVQDAEDAGIAWASAAGVGRLFISVGTLEKPLAPLEIDGPL